MAGDIHTEKVLIAAALKGDQQAFRRIVLQSETLVSHIVSGMVKQQEDREDLVQDIYLKVFKNLGQFGYRSGLSTWIASIAYNTCLNYVKRRKIPLVFPGEIREQEKQYPDEYDPLLQLEQKQATAWVQLEIKKLPPLYQTLLLLYHRDNCSYQQLSSITGLPEGTVKSYLHRARATLKNEVLRYQKKNSI